MLGILPLHTSSWLDYAIINWLTWHQSCLLYMIHEANMRNDARLQPRLRINHRKTGVCKNARIRKTIHEKRVHRMFTWKTLRGKTTGVLKLQLSLCQKHTTGECRGNDLELPNFTHTKNGGYNREYAFVSLALTHTHTHTHTHTLSLSLSVHSYTL